MAQAEAHVIQLAWLMLLLSTAWLAGWAAERLRCPALVAEIVVGMVLGPPVLDCIPFVDALTIIGQLGLILLVLEGGLYIEMGTLRLIGWRAFAIAITGTTLPVLSCLAVLSPMSQFSTLEALAAGTALSSTAIGMAAKLMQDMSLLKTRIGRIICCAAMIDDVASLVLVRRGCRLHYIVERSSTLGLRAPTVAMPGVELCVCMMCVLACSWP
jgi:Kef-type K+ transport system membrane component KefB